MSLEGKENGTSVDALRTQIKTYEKDFFNTNGRKPGRDDIKKDATIAAKYKAYQLATKPLPPPSSTPQKRKRTSIARDALQEMPGQGKAATPEKQTPSKPRRAIPHQTVLSPVHEAEPTPDHIRLQLGPTPQRNGQVLGIFDAIDMIAGTPSKSESAQAGPSDLLVAGTPRKPTAVNPALSKTPQSSSKRFFLDSFAGTPLKRKREDDIETSSASKRKFATPSFLRRSFPLASIEEDSADVASAMPPPFRKRGLVRSLSSIIQGLRRQEEDRMDDDWDVMNEIEQEQEGNGPMKATSKVLVQDSQPGDMPLGPDQALESSEDEEAPGRGDRPRKPWKKKGLKRQTRRTIMRPVKHKAGKEADLLEQDVSEVEVVPETQKLGEAGLDGEDHDEADGDELTKKPKRDSSKTTAQVDTGSSKPKPKRKVNELAHANFKKLKIKNKNKNSKANGGGRRFGGRR